jgi:hypothetical protein
MNVDHERLRRAPLGSFGTFASAYFAFLAIRAKMKLGMSNQVSGRKPTFLLVTT